MSRSEQVLILEPSTELKFCGPFNEVVTSTLKLTNPTDKRACFKVKTTAPRRYCVRPNSGIVDPNGHVNVAVMLQPFEYDPTEKNKHKFMVQTIFAPDGDINLETLFKDADINQLMDSKLRCVFELPADAQATQNNIEVAVFTKQETVEAKSSPKPINTENELRKASEEIKRLREEASSIRQENLQLRNKLQEDSLRLRTNATTGERKIPTVMQTTILPPPLIQEMTFLSYYHLLYMFVALVIGYLMGKFIM